MTKFRTGDRVVDVETGVLGTVIATFTDPEISDEIIAVKFDDGFETMAFPTDDLRRVWAH